MSAANISPAPTTTSPTPIMKASGRDQTSSTDQSPRDTQPTIVGAAPTTGTDHTMHDTHVRHVGSGPFSAPAATRATATPTDEPSRRDADPTLEVES